jgi:hypothetical protein
MIDPYGWQKLTGDDLEYIRQKLAEFEAKDWNQIFVAENQHNHPVSVATVRLSQSARVDAPEHARSRCAMEITPDRETTCAQEPKLGAKS